MHSIVRTGQWITGRLVLGRLNNGGLVCGDYLVGTRRSAFTIVSKTSLVCPNITIVRRFSLKVKKSPELATIEHSASSLDDDNIQAIIDQKASRPLTPPPTFLELDKQHFSAVTKDFTDSLSPRQLKTIEDTGLWKDVPATTLPGAIDHYMRLSKFKLTSKSNLV